jgi:hypothetical protein
MWKHFPIDMTNPGYSEIQGAIVTLTVKGASDWWLGSGFFVDKTGYIATTAHLLIEDYNSETGSWTRAEHVYASIIDANGVKGTQKMLECRIVGFDGTSDVGLVKVIDSTSWTKQKYLTWANSRDEAITGKCYVLGNPGGYDLTSVSMGIIRDNKYNGDFYALPESVLTDSAGLPGNSGGPIVNKDGAAIGIYGYAYGSSGNFGGGTAQYLAKNIINRIMAWDKAGKPQRDGYGNRSTNPTYPSTASHPYVDNNGEYIKGYLGIEECIFMSSFINYAYYKEVYGISFDKLEGEIVWWPDETVSCPFAMDDVLVEIDGVKLGVCYNQYGLSSVLWYKRPGDTVTIKYYTSSDNFAALNTKTVTLMTWNGVFDAPLSSSTKLPISDVLKDENRHVNRVLPTRCKL